MSKPYERDDEGFIGIVLFMVVVALGAMGAAMGVLYALGKLARLVGW